MISTSNYFFETYKKNKTGISNVKQKNKMKFVKSKGNIRTYNKVSSTSKTKEL